MKKNSGKAPSEQFYYKDFAADMLEHAPDIVGAWTLVLVKIWHEKNGGQITKTIGQFALIMHTDTTNAKRFLDYFSSEKIADVTEGNGKITVTNRRAKRDSKLREQNKIRQQRHRESDGKYGSNAAVTVKNHHPSSSTSSSSSSSTPIPTSPSTENNNPNTNSPGRRNSGPESEIGIGKNSFDKNLELDLEKDKKIIKARDKLAKALDDILHPTGKECTTFARIIVHLVNLAQKDINNLKFFDEAGEWANKADKAKRAGAIRNPRAIFVAQVKKETSFKRQEMILR